MNGQPDLTFRYSVVRLWQESIDAMLATGPGLAPLALLTNEADRDLPAAFERFHRRLRSAGVADNVRESLLGSAFVLGGLRYTDDRILECYMSLNNILEDSTTYQWLLRKGRTKGTQGVLLRQGSRRFGPPSEATEATLAAITDEERLGRISDRIFDATGWDDLLATE